jgi:hypothetical protein
LIAGLVAMLAVAAFLLRDGAEASGPSIAKAGMEPPALQAAVAADLRTAASPVPAPAAPTRISPPVFDQIQIEKEEVCEGEENLVTVRAHTTDGNDAFLHYTVAGEAGAQVPVRAYLGRDGKAMAQTAVVFSRDNVATAVQLPSWTVKNCKPARILIVTARMLPNSVAEREFTAVVQALDGLPFQPAWYEWSFGDGAQDVTPGPLATHDYAALPQKTAFTDLLVKVKAIDGRGQSVEGRLPVHIRNIAFAARQRGVAVIFAQPTPRFPEMGADGVVRQKFRIWHGEEVPIQVTGLTLSRSLLPGAPGAAPPVPSTVALDHGRALQFGEIPAGRVLEQSLEHDFAADPKAYAVTYAIQGVTPAGLQARGELTLLRPPPRPTRENSVAVDDPEMALKIRRAMSILNQPSVSQEDLWRLEREGRLR